MNKKCVELLKKVINNNYHNVRLDNMSYNDDEFYYEFKSDEQVSENDFEKLEEDIRKLDNNIYVKLLRVSGVYFEGNSNNEMITRIVGKAFDSGEELDKYNAKISHRPNWIFISICTVIILWRFRFSKKRLKAWVIELLLHFSPSIK